MTMEQWVIYDHPSDFPRHWVVRCWHIAAGQIAVTPDVWLREDLEGARSVIRANYPSGYRMDRQPADDPRIVEVWI